MKKLKRKPLKFTQRGSKLANLTIALLCLTQVLTHPPLNEFIHSLPESFISSTPLTILKLNQPSTKSTFAENL